MNQHQYWAGPEGNEYTARNLNAKVGSVEANTAMFSRILARTRDVKTVVEFGAGAGNNLRAIHHLMPFVELTAFEINQQAIKEMPTCVTGILPWSITDPKARITSRDLAFTKGLLIHIPPADLGAAYETLWRASHRYILLAEYYSPTPTEIDYRGRKNLLWKRDFAGEMMFIYPTLKLIDYGFVSRYDAHPQDDLNWWLMEKQQ